MGITAVYPGTFDPVTYGHLDIIRRASNLFDEVVVAAGRNIRKDPIFDADERIAFIRGALDEAPNVRVQAFEGLVVELCAEVGADVLLRGVRTYSDFEGEFQMAMTNRTFAPDLETIFMLTSLETSFLSSRLIREAAALGGDVSEFVPPAVAEALPDRVRPAT